MPRRNWGAVIAIVGLVIGAIALTASTKPPNAERVPNPGPSVKKHGSCEACTSKKPTNDSPLPVRIIESPDDTARAQEREAKSDKHDAEDLKAQQDAANAAQRAAASAEREEVPAIVQIILASFGTVIALIALITSIWTTIRADRTSRAELRAYVSGEPNFIVAFDATNFSGGRFAIKNVGQTPALKVRSRATVEIFPEPLPPNYAFPEITNPFFPAGTVFPGSDFTGTVRATRLFTQNEIDAVRAFQASPYIYGTIEYIDIFGTPHETRFSRRAVGDQQNVDKLVQAWKPSDLEIRFATTEQHNETT